MVRKKIQRNMISRNRRISILFAGAAIAVAIFLFPSPVTATQPHGDPEGLVIHQFSHVFFIFSMAILVYWLHKRKLSRQPGWWEIKYAAIFLALWSADAFAAHMLEEHLEWIVVNRVDSWTIHIENRLGWKPLTWIYYIVKLDHLLCVPGLFLLYRGLACLSALKDEAMGAGKGAS